MGRQIIANSELQTALAVCTDLYQGQRNIVVVPAPSGSGGRLVQRFGFLSGAPRQKRPSKTTIAAPAINQGDHVDPVLLKVLTTGRMRSFRSNRLPRHLDRFAWHGMNVRGTVGSPRSSKRRRRSSKKFLGWKHTRSAAATRSTCGYRRMGFSRFIWKLSLIQPNRPELFIRSRSRRRTRLARPAESERGSS